MCANKPPRSRKDPVFLNVIGLQRNGQVPADLTTNRVSDVILRLKHVALKSQAHAARLIELLQCAAEPMDSRKQASELFALRTFFPMPKYRASCPMCYGALRRISERPAAVQRECVICNWQDADSVLEPRY